MHFFLGNIYSTGLKFIQVICESFDYDLTHEFFIHDFNKYNFYDDKFLTVIEHTDFLFMISINIFFI